jgi:DNA (cytosine-5)-methyltransferase 1
MRLGGLFSGIGGFELAWTRLGGEVAWMCEWDRNARKVLEARFPGVPIYPDVRDLDPAEVEPVDVLTGGSPCQGFSVAGKRTGLEHGESQLFADYIRIMDGLADRGLKWALWENVPGVLSIKNPDGERTFPHVIAALAGADEPVRLDPRRKWNVGLASGVGRAVAWRVLDSRYFGVAQRRRRVFACVAFGGAGADRAGRALLAVAEGVRGHSAEGVEAREGAAGSVATGAGGPGVPAAVGTLTAKMQGMSGWAPYNETEHLIPDRAGVPSVTGAVTLKWAKGTGGPSGDEAQNLVTDFPQAFNWQSGGDARGLDLTDQPSALTTQQTPAVLLTMREGAPGGGKGPLLSSEESLTLATGNGQTLFQPQAFDAMNFTTADQHHVLRAGKKQSTGVVEPIAFRKSARAQSSDDSETWVDDGVANTVNTFDVGDARTTHAIVEPPSYGVRRLTPVECERLQAFPDGWTEPAGSDSARYKALGNAVTVNTVWWILRRMKEQG